MFFTKEKPLADRARELFNGKPLHGTVIELEGSVFKYVDAASVSNGHFRGYVLQESRPEWKRPFYHWPALPLPRR